MLLLLTKKSSTRFSLGETNTFAKEWVLLLVLLVNYYMALSSMDGYILYVTINYIACSKQYQKDIDSDVPPSKEIQRKIIGEVKSKTKSHEKKYECALPGTLLLAGRASPLSIPS